MNGQQFDYGEALRLLKKGSKLARSEWNDIDGKYDTPYIFLFKPEKDNLMPFIVECNETGEHQPYTPTHEDQLAEDWTVVPD